MFGALGPALGATCVTFVSKAAMKTNLAERLNLHRQLVSVGNTRELQKSDMLLNSYTPDIEVDSQTYEVRADGELLTCEPAHVLPLAQRYFLF
jgi:urease subunit alpha